MRASSCTSRLCLHSSQPYHCACEMNETHECGECFLAAQSDAPEPLEFVEEAFDLMTFFVEFPVDWWSARTAWVRLDLRGCLEIVGNENAERISVISGVGDDMADALQAGEEDFGLRAVSVVSRRWMDTDRQADGIDDSVQFCRQSTA